MYFRARELRNIAFFRPRKFKIMTKKLQTISIKGKEYVMVNQRLLAFNEDYKNGAIKTEVVAEQQGALQSGLLRVKATVIPDVKNPDRFFTGYSEIIRDISKPLTTPQMLETVETSAVGRALAMMGIGIIESVASADELVKAGVSPDLMVKLGICDHCGKTAAISKKSGRQYCPAWQKHKEAGEKNTIIFPPEPLNPKMQEFSDSLEN